jgi:acid phosphatase
MKLALVAATSLFLFGCDAASTVVTDDAAVGGPDLGGTDVDQLGAPAPDLAGADLAGVPAPDLASTSPGSDGGVVVGDDGGAASPYLFPAVWVILMENHDRPTLLASPSAPHLQTLASTYAQAAKYTSSLAPSLPNYIEMTCGCDANHYTFTSTDGTAASLINTNKPLFSETSLGGQLEAAKVPWRAYAQDSAAASKLTPCYPGNTGEYVARHVPFVYFQDVFGTGKTASATCTNRVRVFGDPTAKTGDFYTDLAAGTYAYQWITPDLLADMHDGTIAQGDAFLDKVVTAIQATPQYQAGGVIFITWDEGETSTAILFVAISKRAKMGYQSMTVYTHDNFLATIEDIFHLSRTGAAVGKANMLELFN